MLTASRSRRGVAAPQFALIAPVVALMIIGLFDMAKALILRQEVINAAHAISLTASLLAVQPDGTTALSHADVQAVESDLFAEIPWLRSGVENGTASVTLSGIEFKASPSGCLPYRSCASWTPYVAWSVPYRPANRYGVQFAFPVRRCGAMKTGVLDIRANMTTPITPAIVMTSLRSGGVTYPDPILVADVRYSYPVASFLLRIFVGGTLDFVASAYWPVRTVPSDVDAAPDNQIGSGALTVYDRADVDTGVGAHCAGLP